MDSDSFTAHFISDVFPNLFALHLDSPVLLLASLLGFNSRLDNFRIFHCRTIRRTVSLAGQLVQATFGIFEKYVLSLEIVTLF